MEHGQGTASGAHRRRASQKLNNYTNVFSFLVVVAGWQSSAHAGHAPQWHGPKTLVSFVHIGKTGSSSMRAILRSVRPKNLLYDTGPKGDCHYLKTCNVNMDSPTVELINGMGYGVCARTRQPCRYFTILREPIPHLISAYNYFCLDCEDSKKFCGRLEEAKVWSTCPKMAFLDFAKNFANWYTRLFGGTYTPENTFFKEHIKGANRTGSLTPRHLASAIAALCAADMLVLDTFTLFESGLAALSASFNGPPAGLALADLKTPKMINACYDPWGAVR